MWKINRKVLEASFEILSLPCSKKDFHDYYFGHEKNVDVNDIENGGCENGKLGNGSETGRERGSVGDRERGSVGGRERGSVGGREGGSVGGRERGSVGGREGGREENYVTVEPLRRPPRYQHHTTSLSSHSLSIPISFSTSSSVFIYTYSKEGNTLSEEFNKSLRNKPNLLEFSDILNSESKAISSNNSYSNNDSNNNSNSKNDTTSLDELKNLNENNHRTLLLKKLKNKQNKKLVSENYEKDSDSKSKRDTNYLIKENIKEKKSSKIVSPISHSKISTFKQIDYFSSFYLKSTA